MKRKIRILKEDRTIYYGKLIELPVKEDAMIQKSIELFDDEDPCIIHQSYVQKEFADVVKFLLDHNNNKILGKDFLEDLYFLDVSNIQDITIITEG